jgi:hypothetical protein
VTVGAIQHSCDFVQSGFRFGPGAAIMGMEPQELGMQLHGSNPPGMKSSCFLKYEINRAQLSIYFLILSGKMGDRKN